ncbi:MAG: pectin acetylesterase [Comamonadaceae bacterium PBBC2]|nr:MAG: pectin acetylesterase [Comamonadaceae bacterium PBBC2]
MIFESDEIIALSAGAANCLDGTWPDRVCRQPTRAELHVYRAPMPISATARGRALVYAGGGYLQLVHDKEGVEIARWLNSQGIDAYVLLHRLPGQRNGQGNDPSSAWPFDIALQDGLRALDHLATLPPLPLLHVGLSSGGHLAGVMSCQHHAVQGCGVLIAYAPVNANHRDYKAPVGKPDFPPPEKQAFYNAWPIGLAAEPQGLPTMPIFLAYALHDAIVPIEHALNFIRSARDAGLQLDAHIFNDAPHGFALRELGGSQQAWPTLALDWIARRLATANP